MKKKLISLFSVLLICCVLFQSTAFAVTKYPMNYIYVDGKNESISDSSGRIYIPITYSVNTAFSYIEDPGATSFNNPDDLFIDAKDNIYVADTGNNRIVKLSPDGETLAIYYDASGSPFVEPRGVFVSEDETIYIADSGNGRIVKMDQQGTLLEEYGKPESELLENLQSFDPSKIAVGPTGYMYILVGKEFMSIDMNNQFKGYIGSTELDFSLSQLLINMFATKEQKKKMDKRNPPSYNNFMIDSEGRFVACSSAKKDQIRIINSVGRNIYEKGFYGEILDIDDTTNEYVYPMFIDLPSDQNGVISALDQRSGHIYQYDQEGNLLTVFAGLGDNKGYFEKPVSIAADSEGNLFVLDAVRNNIQKFQSTTFMDKIHEASQLYFDGKYDESLGLWEEIVTINADYPLARRRIGAIYYKEKDYERSKDEYKLADDMEGYSEAFSKYRHEFVRNHFVVTILIAAAVIAVLVILVILAKKYADRVRDKIYGERRGEK